MTAVKCWQCLAPIAEVTPIKRRSLFNDPICAACSERMDREAADPMQRHDDPDVEIRRGAR